MFPSAPLLSVAGLLLFKPIILFGSTLLIWWVSQHSVTGFCPPLAPTFDPSCAGLDTLSCPVRFQTFFPRVLSPWSVMLAFLPYHEDDFETARVLAEGRAVGPSFNPLLSLSREHAMASKSPASATMFHRFFADRENGSRLPGASRAPVLYSLLHFHHHGISSFLGLRSSSLACSERPTVLASIFSH
jgi:hypothetical protein